MRELTTEAKVGLLAIVDHHRARDGERSRVADTPSGGRTPGVPSTRPSTTASGLTKSHRRSRSPACRSAKSRRSQRGREQGPRPAADPPQRAAPGSTRRVVIRGKGILGDKIISIVPGSSKADRRGDAPRTTRSAPARPEADLEADDQARRRDRPGRAGGHRKRARQAVGTPEGKRSSPPMPRRPLEVRQEPERRSPPTTARRRTRSSKHREMTERLNQVVDHSGNDLDRDVRRAQEGRREARFSSLAEDRLGRRQDRPRRRNDGRADQRRRDGRGPERGDLRRERSRRTASTGCTSSSTTRASSGRPTTARDGNSRTARCRASSRTRTTATYCSASPTIPAASSRRRARRYGDHGRTRPTSSSDPTTCRSTRSTTRPTSSPPSSRSVGQRSADASASRSRPGGAGADAWLFHDALKVSADVYQFDRGRRAIPTERTNCRASRRAPGTTLHEARVPGRRASTTDLDDDRRELRRRPVRVQRRRPEVRPGIGADVGSLARPARWRPRARVANLPA